MFTKPLAAFYLTLLVLGAIGLDAKAQGILVPTGSLWKYLDNGTDTGVAWRQPAFDDNAWKQGAGQLGYGDGDEATVVGYGADANNKYITTYFRRAFVVSNAAGFNTLNLRTLRDDGIVVYLNGAEIWRDTMPAGTVTSTTLASAAAADDGLTWQTFTTSGALLSNGTNVLAVEIHQSAANSSDISFEIELRGTNAPPAVSLTSPANNTTVNVGAIVNVTASPTDAEGVASVEFFQNGVSLGLDTTAPYSLALNNVPEGSHTFTATVTDTDGATAVSAPVVITVNDPNPPRLAGIAALSNTVTVVFSKRLVPPSATTAGNYSINNGATISTAAFSGSPSSNTIVLATSTLTPGLTYTLTVNNVQDALGQSIAANAQTNFIVLSFTAVDVGTPAPAGVTTSAGGGLNVTVGGNDIGGTADQFSFNYQTVAGNFDFKVRVAGLSVADTWSKAGLMARDTLAAGSMFAAALGTPGAGGSFFEWRPTAATAALTSGSFPVNYPNTWLRLQRTNNLFTGAASFDGENWMQLGSATVSMASSLFVGVAVSSRTNSIATVAQFRDFQTTVGGSFGTVTLDTEPPGPSSRKTPFVITEIMYSTPTSSTDTNIIEFIELFNSNPFFEEISRYRISGDIDFEFPPNTFLQANSYVVIARDPVAVRARYGITNVMGPYTNTLKSSGLVRLRNNSGGIVLDVSYSNQPPWPAGADNTGHSLVLARPSHGEAFPEAWAASDRLGGSPGGADGFTVTPQRAVVINEFLANSTGEDYIELYNHGNQVVDLSGCTLSDDPRTNKFVIPAGATIPARGYLVFYQSDTGFGLSSEGETIYFRSAGGTRVLDVVRFPAQAEDVSSGRFPDGAKEFYPLSAKTPGVPNTAILIGDIVINEIMYKPISGKKDDEYVELFNQGTGVVSLAGWKFTAGIDYTFPTNSALAPGGYLVVARNLARLLTNYPNLNSTNTAGDFQGSLPNRGGRLALAMPDTAITTNGLGVTQTNTVYVVVEEVTYGTGGNWGHWANEGGSSLELIDPRANHRLAHNWADSDETSKAPWTTIDFTGSLDNGSDGATALEGYLMGEGECLLDDVQMSSPTVSSGNNLVPNGNFADGLGTWTARGNHIRSSLDPNGFSGGQCLHVRSSARGDSIINRLYVRLPTAMPTTGTGTIRAKARWLRGWPELLLRTHGNYLDVVARLSVPANLGTPGARNSRAGTNAPPAIYEVAHNPVIPAASQPVVVTARRHDPDGVSSMLVKYRVDAAGSYSYTPVAMRDDGQDGDAVADDGVFSATIPGQSAGVLVAFQVMAVDSLGATNLFPLQNPAYARPFECLVRFGDPILTTAFGTYRQWLTADNLNDWQNRPALSNERIFETFVYGGRAVYNASTKWSASPYHQFTGSPVTVNAHYSIELPTDDMVLGTENINKMHLPGNSAGDDTTLQREQVGYWTARQLDLPWGYRRYINMFVNGTRRGGAVAMMEDSQTPGSDMIEEYFNDDQDGHLYKLQPWFETDDSGAQSIGFRNVSWCTQLKFTSLSNGVPMHKTARYRNNYLVRAANGTANDYAHVFSLIDAANSGPPGSAALTANYAAVADLEQWFHIFACEHATGNWDSVGARNEQNMYGYKPTRDKWKLMIWDWNILLGNSGSWGPGADLFTVISGQAGPPDTVMQGFYSHPPFRRMYLRSLKEICTGPWQSNRVEPLLNAKHRAMVNSGVTPADPVVIKSWISSARSSILTTIAAEDATVFKITGTNTITLTNNLLTITGEAPVEAQTIRINGVDYPIIWVNVKSFRIQIALSAATNTFALQAYDRFGNALASFATNLTAIYTGPVAPPESALIINEIMYNPVTPNASFVEIFNTSAASFDLSGWRVNGLGYTFPSGSLITNNQYLVLAGDRAAFTAIYTNAFAFGEFSGQLDDGGEALSLERPIQQGTNTAYVAVNRVKYDDDPPWPASPDGYGPSLQLLDTSRDNARVSNWGDGSGWRQVVYTGTLQGSPVIASQDTNFVIFLNTPGDVYLDDLVLVLGTVPGAGPNLLQNGDFESALTGPWIAFGNHSTSAVSTAFSRSGSASLHVIGGTGNPGSAALRQPIAGYTTNMVATLSYWFMPTTNASQLTLRTRPSATMNSISSVRPLFATPGVANTGTASLPAYDALWINELQPNNLTGPADNQGEHDPWIELYNGGPTPIDLAGYHLADNVTTNLLQWPLPAGTLAPGEFKLVWADGQLAQSTPGELHANFRLNTSTGTVALVRLLSGRPQITDYLNYAGVAPDLSYGDFPDGQPIDRQVFFAVTPGATNSARDITVFINEWMASNLGTLANPSGGAFDDWFELYNPGNDPVDLKDYYLTDNLANPNQSRIPAGYVIPSRGFLLVWADGQPVQSTTNQSDLHVSFKLGGALGESIGLFAPNGFTAIDTVSFGPQTNDISQGRFADGAASVYDMTTPTPRAANTIGQANTAPTLAPIADQTIRLGQTATFTAAGSDADFPAQTLNYSLEQGSPAGANIVGVSGLFTWAPTPAQAPGAHAITVRVTDGGTPPLSATRSFQIIVRLPPIAAISNDGSGHVTVGFDTIAGRTYRIEWKNRLDEPFWNQLGGNIVAGGDTLTVNDNIGANPQRFYQILQVD